jgi:hypothetical protein
MNSLSKSRFDKIMDKLMKPFLICMMGVCLLLLAYTVYAVATKQQTNQPDTNNDLHMTNMMGISIL